ncbi:MAG: DUF445 family protein [Desulfuromonas sp.]|nr:DUF445 family protein [Desulfuromonas thiophila]
MEILAPCLPWLIPPLLGALIGYVTNHIAIRMLFRPLRPWHLLGWRVPLTPGIIPARRTELARKMGAMVGDHLLTPTDLATALDRPDVRAALEQTIARQLDQLLAQPLGPAARLLPAEFQPRIAALLDLLRLRLARGLLRASRRPALQRQLRQLCQQGLDQLAHQRLDQLLPPQRYHRLRDQLLQRLVPLLGRRVSRQLLTSWLLPRLQQTLTSDHSLRQTLPALAPLLHQLLPQLTPQLGMTLATLLRQQDTQQLLNSRAREALDGFIDSIDGLRNLVAMLFSGDALYAHLPQLLEQQTQKLAGWLDSPAGQDALSSRLLPLLDALLDCPLRQLSSGLSEKQLRPLLQRLLGQLLRQPELQRQLSQLLDRLYHQQRHQTLAGLLPTATSRSEAAELLTRTLLRLLRERTVLHQLDRGLSRLLHDLLYRRPIGRLDALLPSDARAQLNAVLYQRLRGLLQQEIPPLAQRLDICRLVEDKINGLDILQVEGLLLGIMKEQFRYINLFGALLGFLLGLLNLLLLA